MPQAAPKAPTSAPPTGLLLTGGGARAAYQVGVQGEVGFDHAF